MLRSDINWETLRPLGDFMARGIAGKLKQDGIATGEVAAVEVFYDRTMERQNRYGWYVYVQTKDGREFALATDVVRSDVGVLTEDEIYGLTVTFNQQVRKTLQWPTG